MPIIVFQSRGRIVCRQQKLDEEKMLFSVIHEAATNAFGVKSNN